MRKELGGRNSENPQRKDFGGFGGILKAFWKSFPRKHPKKHQGNTWTTRGNNRKQLTLLYFSLIFVAAPRTISAQNIEKLHFHCFSLVFLCFGPRTISAWSTSRGGWGCLPLEVRPSSTELTPPILQSQCTTGPTAQTSNKTFNNKNTKH